MLNRTWMFLCGVGLVSSVAVAAPTVVEVDNGPVVASQEDESEGGFYMNVGVGGMRLHNASSHSGSNLRGVQEYLILRLGWDFEDSPWSIEASGMIAPDLNRASYGSTRKSGYGLGLEGLYHLSDRYAAFDPFLAAGVGIYGADEMWQNGDSDLVVGQAGLGFNYHFSEDFSFRMDARYHVAVSGEYMAFTTVDASLTWHLGRKSDDGADNVEPLTEEVVEEPVKLEEGAEASGNEKLLDVTPEGADDTMHFELRVQFKKDSAILDPVDYPVLDELTMAINEALAANPEVFVTIDGHADRQHGSDYNYNLNLSKNRARSVAVYLNNAGIPMEKMQTAGHSFDKPLDPVNLDEGTPTNRRTDVVIRGVDAATRAKIRENRLRNKTK